MNLLKNANSLISASSPNGPPAQNSGDQMEGTVAIAAVKRQVTNNLFAANNPANNYSTSLEGKITYQRNGETFYIPYLLTDVVNVSSSQYPLKIGDRVKFCVAQVTSVQQQQMIYATTSSQLPLGSFYARRVELIQSPTNSLLSLFNEANSGNFNYPTSKKSYRGIISNLKVPFSFYLFLLFDHLAF